jgi:DNA-binding CsgD family transcriptional regulator
MQSICVGGTGLVDLTCAFTGATNFDELERAFRCRFGVLMGSPMFGFYVLEPGGPGIELNVSVNVSDVFVARYVDVMDVDPLLARARETGKGVYNLDLMSAAEWAETEVYRSAYSMHAMSHVLEVPVIDGAQILGALHLATHRDEREYTASDLALAEAVAGVLAISIRNIRAGEQRTRALYRALTALRLTGTALVFSERHSPALEVNEAARRLLDEIVDGDARVPELLVRCPGGGRFSRRVEVQLTTGQTASLHAHSQPGAADDLVTVLELKRDHPQVDRSLLATLTARESEVALLVVQGLGDREIAVQLCLSRYTVQQYVKRIYRALDVDSRVALTRLLLGAPVHARRT